MHFATLASGSSGNAILVGEENRNFLVDCGITVKKMVANLEKVQISVPDIEGIVITHEHSDHIKGVGALARKFQIPIYASSKIWEAMRGNLGALKPANERVIVGETLSLAGMDIKMIPTSHDSQDSYGLKISGKKHCLGIATDSGMVTEAMHQNLQGCDAYVVEANHDLQTLWHGRYPWYLKKRINSNYGHLSNVQLAEALKEWLMENTQKVVLAHLSEENNTPELALSTVLGILRDSNVKRRCPGLKIRVAPRYEPHELITLSE